VIFVDFDSTVIDTQVVTEGNAATAPQDPVRSGYTFTGWDTPFNNVTSDLTITATYTALPPTPTFTVTFEPGDHGTFATQATSGLASGDPTPAPPQTDGEVGWRFTGWQPTLASTVTDDVTYTAQWEAIVIPPTSFTVTFVDFDSTVIDTQVVAEGAAAIAPADPVRAGYTFACWDTPFNNVIADLTVTATYTLLPPAPTFTVIFVDFDGTVIDTQVVAEGDAAVAPINPVRVGYTFAGWDTAFTNVTADLTVTATYTPLPPAPTFTVIFAPGDHGAFATQTLSGFEAGDLTPAPPSADGEAGWRFIGWQPTVAATVTADATYTAQWERITYTISYNPGTYGMGLMPSVTVNAGSSYTVASSSFTPVPGYAFSGWDATGTPSTSYAPNDTITITGDITLTARWESVVVPPTTHTVTFVDFDSTVIDTQVVAEGDAAVAPANPVRVGYTFAGWDTPFNNVTSDLTVTATYTALPPTTFTVTFAPGDHGTFAPQVTLGLVAGEATPQAPQPGAETGWRFSGWTPALASTVIADVTYIAQWERITHTVSYLSGTFGSGFMPTVTVNAEDTYTVAQSTFTPQSGYTFVGWDVTGATSTSYMPGNTITITGDITLTARWEAVVVPPITPTVYTVTFIDFDGKVISTQVVNAGNSVTPPPPPVRLGFSFVGWDISLSNITSNLVAKAIYTNQLSTTFSVTFDPGGHGAFAPQITKGLVVGDLTPTPPQPDAGAGWRFVGWLPALAPTVSEDVTYTAQWESTTPPEVPTPPTPPATQPAAPAPTVTINNPTSTPASVPDTYVTVPGSTSSSTDTTQESATESSTASSTTSTGTGGAGSQTQTAIPDEQTPLAGSNTDVADEPAAPNLLIILLALLFLALMIVLGWLLLRHTRY
jgi:uncharacterized repeat protein (TIGR02543 family)